MAWGCGSPPSHAIDGGAPRDAAIIDAAPGEPDAAPDAGLPDLTIFGPRVAADLAIEEHDYEEDACELDPDEDCIGGPGVRRLLRFSVETPNLGAGDVFLGSPSADNDAFQYSTCHMHYHFLGYADYRLKDSSGVEVAHGHKQAFCLVDTSIFPGADPTVSLAPTYYCGYQGIQRGWSDVYASDLPCQFVDITGVPDGDYTLVIDVNAAGTLAELDTSNNTLEVPVTIGDTDLATPTESCPDDADPHAYWTANRECGWIAGPVLSCTPGTMVRVGCADECDLGTCSGDPMLRVCDATRADGNCSSGGALGQSNNACFSSCPRTDYFECPASGSLATYHAPHHLGDDYACEPALHSK